MARRLTYDIPGHRKPHSEAQGAGGQCEDHGSQDDPKVVRSEQYRSVEIALEQKSKIALAAQWPTDSTVGTTGHDRISHRDEDGEHHEDADQDHRGCDEQPGIPFFHQCDKRRSVDSAQ